MLDWLVDTTCAVAIVLLLCGAFYVIQLVTERFVLNTLPIIMEVYIRIRDRNKYDGK